MPHLVTLDRNQIHSHLTRGTPVAGQKGFPGSTQAHGLLSAQALQRISHRPDGPRTNLDENQEAPLRSPRLEDQIDFTHLEPDISADALPAQ